MKRPALLPAIVFLLALAAYLRADPPIATDDLFAFVTPHLAKVQNPKDVHFTSEGYEMLGQQVASSIESLLK